MAHPISAGLRSPYTASAGRKFGVTVGVALALLALIARSRGHPVSFLILGVPGTVLLIAALVIPARLGPVESGWMWFASVLSKLTTPLFMGIVYFIILTPLAFIRRLGGNALLHDEGTMGFWVDRSQSPRSTLEHQF